MAKADVYDRISFFNPPNPTYTIQTQTGILRTRRVKQEISEQGISPRGVSELQKRRELKRSAKLVKIPEAKDIYRFLSIIMDSVKGRVTGDY